jgi:hypothetical protein
VERIWIHSVRTLVCTHDTIRVPAGRTLIQIDIEVFNEICLAGFGLHLGRTSITVGLNGILYESLCIYWS